LAKSTQALLGIIFMTRLRYSIFSGLLAILCQSAAVSADSATNAAFEAADNDGDGKVTYEEFRNRALMVFPHLDTNDDGRISASEHHAVHDGNGKPVSAGDVDADQYNIALRSFFDEVDVNDDGSLDVREWSGGGKATEAKQ
jgi:Ca2+-binding EF-hand superfamily protein